MEVVGTAEMQASTHHVTQHHAKGDSIPNIH
jgi:hypothetical protein